MRTVHSYANCLTDSQAVGLRTSLRARVDVRGRGMLTNVKVVEYLEQRKSELRQEVWDEFIFDTITQVLQMALRNSKGEKVRICKHVF